MLPIAIMLEYQFGVFLIDFCSPILRFHLTNLANLGIMKCYKEAGSLVSYSIIVTPEEHPECFPESMQKSVVTGAKHATIKPPAQPAIGA